MNGSEAPEVLVIGGGPGGLAAALYLARFRRRVLVVDEGKSRAAKIPCSHNYPGFPEGVVGAELVALMKQQAQRHGARFSTGRVETLSREAADRHAPFIATWQSGEQTRAGHVILATGMSDVPPSMPHLGEALQQGALRYCPVCDGYEVIGQEVGVIADQGSDTFEALYLRHFSDRVTVFIVSNEVRFTQAQHSELDKAGIAIIPTPIDSIRLWNGRVTVRYGEDQTTIDSLYCALGMKVHSQLATTLGAEHDQEGYLIVDEHHQTTVPGLYAVGDVAKGLNQIAVATGGAATASAAIHLSLL